MDLSTYPHSIVYWVTYKIAVIPLEDPKADLPLY